MQIKFILFMFYFVSGKKSEFFFITIFLWKLWIRSICHKFSRIWSFGTQLRQVLRNAFCICLLFCPTPTCFLIDSEAAGRVCYWSLLTDPLKWKFFPELDMKSVISSWGNWWWSCGFGKWLKSAHVRRTGNNANYAK